MVAAVQQVPGNWVIIKVDKVDRFLSFCFLPTTHLTEIAGPAMILGMVF